MKPELTARLERVGDRVRRLQSVLVAFSGGVDSSLVMDIAHRVLGDNCHAVIARSPSLPAAELGAALELGRSRGVSVTVLDTEEVGLEGYRRNQPDRCYFCKNELYSRLVEQARVQGLGAVLDGFNHDDRSDWRPGRRAAVELGVISPLDEARLSKADVRVAARELGLANWDKPEAACLSSRVPYGTLIDASVLGRIERAEAVLHAEGFRQVRVRHGGAIAVIEVELAELPRLREPELLQRVSIQLREIGYPRVSVDPEGYRKGSLNVAVH
ncbi:MAG: ATP-dependent sacrificial sulfur transferase LarE [Candidatus Dormibacteria bacterium]